jgi:transposase
MVFAQKPANLKAAMADILENAEADLRPQIRNLIDMLWGEWKLVEQQIEELNDELERISACDAGCIRIRQIPGIGPVVATAIVTAVVTGLPFVRQTVCRMARHRSTPVLDWRQGEAAGHQQAGKRVPAQDPDSWCTSCRATH